MVVGMDDRTATPKADGLSFMRVIRGAEGSLVALGFALAILLIGTPLALWARVVYEGLSWLVWLRRENIGSCGSSRSVSSVLGPSSWSPYLSDCSSDSSTGGTGVVPAGAVAVRQIRG